MAVRSNVASRSELLAAGFEPSRIKNWMRNGWLILVLRGVYSFGRDVDTREAALRAALLAAGPGSALTGRTACEQWGIISPSSVIPQYIEVAVSTGEARLRRGVSPVLRNTWINIVRRQLDVRSVRRTDGVAVTSVLQALVDLAVRSSRRDVRFAFLEACRLKLIARRDMDRLRELMAGRRGAEKLKPMIALLEVASD